MDPLASAELRDLSGRLIVAAHLIGLDAKGWRIGLEEPDGSTTHPTREISVNNAAEEVLLTFAMAEGRVWTPEGAEVATARALERRGLVRESFDPGLSFVTTDAGRVTASVLKRNPVGAES